MLSLSGSKGSAVARLSKISIVSCSWASGLVARLFCSSGFRDWVNLSPCWTGGEVPTPPRRPGLDLI